MCTSLINVNSMLSSKPNEIFAALFMTPDLFFLSFGCYQFVADLKVTRSLSATMIKKCHFPFSFKFSKRVCWTPELRIIQRLFALSASFEFHGTPLLTFNTDPLDLRGFH